MISRREFVERAALSTGALALGDAAIGQVSSPLGKSAKLGKTGIVTSLIGIGTGSVGVGHQSNQTRLGQPKFTELMLAAYEQGIRFFDLADQYGSMPFFKEPLKKLPREKIVIQSKSNSRTPDALRADIDRFRKELDTDMIDTLLIHCVMEPDWNVKYRPIMDVLSEAREKGIIRAHGCSCHTFEALDAASREPWVQVDLARFNPWGKIMDGKAGQDEKTIPSDVKPVLQRMRSVGKGVIGMKVLAEGQMAKGPDRMERAKESIKFSLASGAVDLMVIGFEAPKQIAEIADQTRLAMAELELRIA